MVCLCLWIILYKICANYKDFMSKHSKDYIKLMHLLHNDNYKLQKLTIKLGTDESKFIFKKEDSEIVFESTKYDVAMLGMSLKQFPNLDYENEFKEVKDLSKYFDDVQFLIDRDKQRLNNARVEIKSGKFKFEYVPEVLLEDFLASNKKASKKFEQLKYDYYHLFNYFAGLMVELQKSHEIHFSKNKKLESQVDLLFKRIMKAINAERAIDSYNKLLTLLDFCPQNKLSEYAQLQKHNNKTFEIMQKSYGNKTSVNNVLHLLLDIYRKLAEFSSDYIKTFAKVEHMIDEKTYNNNFGFSDDYKYLITIPEYKQILKSLDPAIRHSESHLNTVHDEKAGKILLTKKNGRRRDVIREYSYQEFSSISNELGNGLDLVLAMSVSICHIITLFRVIDSFEYKMLLVQIGNKS